MAVNLVEIRVNGVNTMVPSVEIEGRTVIVNGGWVKTAFIRDEEFTQAKPVDDPEAFLAALKQSGLRPDVLTFIQRPPEVNAEVFLSDRMGELRSGAGDDV